MMSNHEKYVATAQQLFKPMGKEVQAQASNILSQSYKTSI